MQVVQNFHRAAVCAQTVAATTGGGEATARRRWSADHLPRPLSAASAAGAPRALAGPTVETRVAPCPSVDCWCHREMVFGFAGLRSACCRDGRWASSSSARTLGLRSLFNGLLQAAERHATAVVTRSWLRSTCSGSCLTSVVRKPTTVADHHHARVTLSGDGASCAVAAGSLTRSASRMHGHACVRASQHSVHVAQRARRARARLALDASSSVMHRMHGAASDPSIRSY